MSTPPPPPPHFLTSVSPNRLRRFSTALLEFLSRYDELQNHCRFIEQSIDSRLSSHNLDASGTNELHETVAGFTEVIVSERNPNESGSGYQRSHAIARAIEGTVVSHNSDEIDGLKMHEGVDEPKTREEIDVSMKDVEIDVLKKHAETGNLNKVEESVAETCRVETITADVFEKPEQTDVCKSPEEIQTVKKHEETNELQKPKVTEYSKENIVAILEILSQNMCYEEIPEVIDQMVKGNLEVEAGEVAYVFGLWDKCHPPHALKTYLHNPVKDIQYSSSFQMVEAMKQHLCNLKSLKRCLESYNVDPSKFLPDVKINEKIQNLEKEISHGELTQKRKSLENPIHQEAKRLCFDHENMPRQHKPIEDHGTSADNQSAQLSTHCFDFDRYHHNSYINDYTGNMALTNTINMSKMAVDINTSKNSKVDVLEKPEETDALSEPEEIDFLKKFGQTDVCKNPEEIDISNSLEEFETTKKHEEFDVSSKVVEIDVSKKREELDTSKNPEVYVLERPKETDVLNKPKEIDFLKKFEQTDVRKNPKEIETVKNHEKIDVSDKAVEIDVSKKREELDTSKNPEVDVLEHPEETDVLNKPEEIDFLKKFEQTDVCKNPEEIDTVKKHEEIYVSNKAVEIDVSKKREERDTSKNPNVNVLEQPEETDVLSKPGEIDFLKKFEQTDVCKNPEAIDTVKKHEEIDVSNKAVEIDVSKKREEIDVSNDHEETHALKSLQEVDVPTKHAAETDTWNTPTGNDTLKKPEGTVAETFYGETLTAVPEAIVLEQTPKRMATNSEETPEKVRVVDISKKPKEASICKNPEETETEKLKKSIISELESMCRNMSIKKLKTYVTRHFSQLNNCHKEIAKALKLAADPAKLVLGSIGRFFVPSDRTFCKDPYLNTVRRTLVLILECFVMISNDGIEIKKTEKEHAAEIAADWRNRMIKGGGLGQTEEVDARGLLLFISGFGFQDNVFKIQDIMDLIRASNMEGIFTALRSSVFLIAKLPEVIDLMVKNNLEIEAADIAFTFGLEDKHDPQKILRTYLHNLVNNARNGSFQTLEALKKQVFDLKFVKEYLESRDTVSSMLREFKVDKKIQNLEKEINQGELTQKMKYLETYVFKKAIEIVLSKKQKEIDTLNETVTETSKRSIISELESLCQNMCSEKVRIHVAKHYSEMSTLHTEIEKAFKLAKDPAKLVLESIGRIFVQGRKVFCNGSYQNVERQATVLILECFVMMSGDEIKIAKEEKLYAAQAAVDWRERMIKEGGLRQVDEIDARGLLLLISGFGIQDHVFKIQDIMDLIRASNVKATSTALRRSVFLIPKVPEVINLMVKNNLEIEAVDIAYTFRLEDKCRPWNILRTYLHNVGEDIQNSSLRMLEAMKQLDDLNSLKQCLESHNVDPSILLPDFNINEMIEYLVREVNVERLMTLKRRSQESPIQREAKRACFDHDNMSHHYEPVYDHYGMSLYNRSTQPSTCYFDQNHPNSYIGNHSKDIDSSMRPGPANGFPGSY